MNLTSPREIREIMARFGISPRKQFGQNFLINDAIPEKIALAAVGDLPETERGRACVLEIGPGIGVMTRALSAICGSVLAVEIDRDLIPVLEYTLADCGNVTVLNRDILDCDIDSITREAFGEHEFHVCANLPYYITTPIIMRLLEHGGERLRSVTVMVQNEVAARLTAAPGTPDYGAITASTAYYGCARKLFTVSPGSFLPAPKVTSAVVKIAIYKPDERPIRVLDEGTLSRVIAGAFGQRRKTLCNALGASFPTLGRDGIENVLRGLGLDARIRGEMLDVGAFAAIADKICESADVAHGA